MNPEGAPDVPSFEHVSQGSTTLGELLERGAESAVDPIRLVRDVRPGFARRAKASTEMSRAQGFAEAQRAAGALSQEGVRAGDRVLLLLPDPREFLAFFFGCQLLGAVAVPLVPPWSLARMEGHIARILTVARVAQPQASVISDEAQAALSAFCRDGQEASSLGRVLSPKAASASPPFQGVTRVSPSAIAMIQFTSGSTQDPRGVQLSHQSLLHNCYAIGARLRFDQEGHLGCSWLPLFHDMGLIGHVLVPLLWRIPTVLLPPQAFAARPESWLQAISHFRATISTAPNFAFQVAATRITEEKLQELDLSSWRIAMCGGEPVLEDTLEAFAARFAPYGFDRSALCPVYGLAEASLAVALPRPEERARTERIDREAFASEGQAIPSPEPDALCIVSCGSAPDGHDIAVRSEHGATCADGVEGRIWVRGPSLMDGYLNDPESTQRSLVDGWLDTGDRGYLRAGLLYVTGREKELIIKGGRNYFPHEIEAAAQVPGVRPGRVAAFGSPDENEGTELLVVVCERSDQKKDDLQLERAIIERVVERVGLRPDRIVLCEKGTLSKTSSGKMQRLLAQKRYVDGELQAARPSLWAAARFSLAKVRLRLL